MTTSEILLTEAEANIIHREWMQLDSHAPEKEKKRVFALMAKLPDSYLAINSSGLGCVMLKGGPAHAFNLPIAQAIDYAKQLGVQTKLRWHCAGYWTSVD